MSSRRGPRSESKCHVGLCDGARSNIASGMTRTAGPASPSLSRSTPLGAPDRVAAGAIVSTTARAAAARAPSVGNGVRSKMRVAIKLSKTRCRVSKEITVSAADADCAGAADARTDTPSSLADGRPAPEAFIRAAEKTCALLKRGGRSSPHATRHERVNRVDRVVQADPDPLAAGTPASPTRSPPTRSRRTRESLCRQLEPLKPSACQCGGLRLGLGRSAK